MSNFPDHDFKIDCGDDPRVRQWLHDNGVRWGTGAPINEFLFFKLIKVDDRRYAYAICTLDSYNNLPQSEISPYDYFQPEPTVAERMAALIEEYKADIPEWARWVAVCDLGSFECGSEKPELIQDGYWDWYANNESTDCKHMGYATDLKGCWRETLTELPTVKHGLIVEDDPVAHATAVYDQQKMIDRDERHRSQAEKDYDLKILTAAVDKQTSEYKPPLTIPSICLAEPTSHMMMLGGEHGGQNYE